MTVSYERFTDRSRRVMQLANQEAQRFDRSVVGTEHVLLGLLKEGSGVAANVLRNLGLDLRAIRLKTEELTGPAPPDQIVLGRLPHTGNVSSALWHAVQEADGLGHNYVGTEHLLLGLLRATGCTAGAVLEGLKVSADAVRAEVRNLLGDPRAGAEGAELRDETLEERLGRQVSMGNGLESVCVLVLSRAEAETLLRLVRADAADRPVTVTETGPGEFKAGEG